MLLALGYLFCCVLVECFQSSPDYILSLPLDRDSFYYILVFDSSGVPCGYEFVDYYHYLVHTYGPVESAHLSVTKIVCRFTYKGVTFDECYSSVKYLYSQV